MSGYESAIIVMAFGFLVIDRLPWVAHKVGDAVAEFHAARLRGEEVLTRHLVLKGARAPRVSRPNGAAEKHEPHEFQNSPVH